MAVYRFRVTFEDYDDISREIDIKSTHTFVDLHKAIHQSVGYDPEYSSSFYISNDQWTKGEELAYKPSERKVNRGVTLMENAKLAKFIDDPHQKFYYTSNFDRPFDFHVELVKILDEAPGATYPLTAKTVGEAPKQFGNVVAPASGTANAVSEDLDFLNEMEYNPEDTEHFSEVTEDGGTDSEENDEEDEFSNEFSDDENYDEEERGGRGGRNDDY
ncbi:plasmid pRiA4b ORF-3 family protein [Mucilaginibacter daejeonensis]|uniref:plasmid pRiA4b ORF-3 family protein n=1 Tax=Mucilaginibacter daejeonensis TaxID=398049 RepID=UPI001D172ED3|nr:plasmid pRiA4b ORF-3 family protein [Mucilaginibacter daejeonensis]UEG52638.1 plasmid pRiA4b ORF-3 family protein [Mucilaginibacter daejeonensis]